MNLHSPKDEHCGFATDEMTTKEIKEVLMLIMIERESVNFILGWLKQAYINPSDEDIERAVAIKQLKEYEAVK